MKAFYDFKCDTCEYIVEAYTNTITKTRPCGKCGGTLVRQFPVEAARGFQPFEAYHDEALGCDITGRKHRQYVMKALNCQEAGDPVHGARNFDKHATEHLKPIPCTGETFTPRVPVQEGEPFLVASKEDEGFSNAHLTE